MATTEQNPSLMTHAQRMKWKEERKSLKRKWKEQKLMQSLEKEKQDKEKEDTKKMKLQSEEANKSEGRQYSVSIALPGSILDNAQSPELRTYLAGQIARAAVVFNIDEIIIFDEVGSDCKTTEGSYDGVGKKGHCNVQMARILQYLECPQYLRKFFFPNHRDLQYAGLLNPLDCPHHTKAREDSQYREGIVVDKPTKEKKGSFIDVGLQKEVQIDKKLTPGLRVTVEMLNSQNESGKLKGKVVSPAAPRISAGRYWGYTVRLASSLGKVFSECPYKEGYDCLIGTSEKGTSVDELKLPSFKHGLVVFGGVKGLEASLDADQDLKVEDPSLLFDHYVNSCPGQGSHTIRTEEAILITMSALRPKIQRSSICNSSAVP